MQTAEGLGGVNINGVEDKKAQTDAAEGPNHGVCTFSCANSVRVVPVSLPILLPKAISLISSVTIACSADLTQLVCSHSALLVAYD